MVNLWAARLLARHELASIPTAETFVFTLLGDFTLAPALPVLLPLKFLGLFFRGNRLILEVRY